MSIIDLSASTPEELAKYLGKSVADAKAMIEIAAAAIEDDSITTDLGENAEIISASAVPHQSGFKRPDGRPAHSGQPGEARKPGEDMSKFGEAERRLREELAAFKLK
jgi:N utilization substance protein A